MNEIESKLFSLVPKDFLKAAILAGITAGVKLLTTSVSAGTIPTDMASWEGIGKVALVASVAYITKNFLTNSDDQFLVKEPSNIADAVKK